ncbi:MAG: hypothetical protein J0I20_22020 [Chloroflexi bacterium]|mgnify:CR=1 FL=1|nr:hypothetical protein [Chloroflexota bacterium]OJW05365.1 MAG: hypothetical protein BGO39_33735 [Chloroflexi bacterium 54-19]
MEKPTSQLVEEAVLAIKQGEISLETGATRFGEAWPEIKGEVALILDLEKAGKSFKTALPSPDLSKIWAQILPDLTMVDIVAGSETTPNSNHVASPDSVIAAHLTQDEKPGPVTPPVSSEKKPEPIKLPARKSTWTKWRKPLAWAAAIVLFVVLSLSSLVGVAQAAEPGDFFYGTKLWLDNARQYVAFSPQDKQNFALSYCAHRSEELEWLVKNNKLQYFSSVAADYRQTLQNAFPNETVTLSSDQVNQLKAQQTRLNQLSGQLSTVNAAGATQASVEVNKLVEQLDAFEVTPQNSPVPTTTAGTPGYTPTASPGASITPSVAPTTTSAITITIGGTTAPAQTPTITSTVGVSPTVELPTAGMTVIVPPASTPTPTPNPGSDTGVVLAYHTTPAPTPTPMVANDGDDQDDDGNVNNTNNDHDADDLPSNSNGSDGGSNSSNGSGNNGQQGPNQTKKATPVPPTPPAPPTPVANPTPEPPAPPPTPEPPAAPTIGPDNGNGSGSGNGNGKGPKDNQPKATIAPDPPKPDKPSSPPDPPNPTKTPKPEKTKKP